MPRRRIPLADLVPRGPVLSARACDRFEDARPSGTAYAGAPTVPFPVLPFLWFGVPYDLDLVVVDDHPAWDMHELARVRTPDGPVWLCKDSRAADLVQTIVADRDDIGSVLPEVPLARSHRRVEVDDSRPGHVEVRYANDHGEEVRVVVDHRPLARQALRNTSTMGHSGSVTLAVLDLSARALASASVTIGGEARPIRRILGLVPFAVALAQTQAGFAAGRWTQDAVGTTHDGTAAPWFDDGLALTQPHPWRTLTARFLPVGDARELVELVAEAWGMAAPACRIRFLPALPDLRFDGAAGESRFRLDVGGQRGHGTGTVRVRRIGDEAEVVVAPAAPAWLADRRLVARLRFLEGTVVAEARVEPLR